jgi:hypothetical protein
MGSVLIWSRGWRERDGCSTTCLVPVQRLRPHADAIPWDQRRLIVSRPNNGKHEEVLVQPVDVLRDTILQRSS